MSRESISVHIDMYTNSYFIVLSIKLTFMCISTRRIALGGSRAQIGHARSVSHSNTF